MECNAGTDWNCTQTASIFQVDESKPSIFFSVSQSATQLSNSADINKSPVQPTDSFVFAGTAVNGAQINSSFCTSSLFSKSLDSTPNGMVWRHNPYAPTVSSNTVET